MIINGIAEAIGVIIEFIGDGFNTLLEFISVPFMFLMAFLEGIFYFVSRLFVIVVKVIQIFVALFQLFFSICAGLVSSFDLDVSFDSGSVSAISMPYYSSQGMQAVIDHLVGTGLMTVVPYAFTAVLYLIFARKIISLLGGNK